MKRYNYKKACSGLIYGVLSLSLMPVFCGAMQVSGFEDLDTLLHPIGPAESYDGGGVYVNGRYLDPAAGFVSGGAHFSNNYNHDWNSWDGFSYSTTTDMVTAGLGNQYSSIAGGGNNGSAAYGVVYWANSPLISMASGYSAPQSVCVTNTTYAYWSMRDGDDFAKQFGGVTGDDEDWFRLDIVGFAADGEETGSTHFYLADFRFADNSADYIVDDWALIDLTPLGSAVATIEFSLSSSDNGDWGMNTPAYFALDDLVVVPEPADFGLVLGLVLMVVIGNRRGLL